MEITTFERAVADTVKELALKKELSGNQLAIKSGVSQAQVSRIFAYKRAISVEHLYLLACALDMKPSVVVAQAEKKIAKENITSQRSTSPSMLSEAEAYKIAEELDRKLRAGMTPEQLGLAAKTREVDPLDARGEESQIPPDWDE